jgi:hypothetical protein
MSEAVWIARMMMMGEEEMARRAHKKREEPLPNPLATSSEVTGAPSIESKDAAKTTCCDLWFTQIL